MSNATQTSREAVLARIQASSKDSVILEEMQRLGFWPAGSGTPDQQRATELISQEQALLSELRELNQKLSIAKDPVAALKALNKQRMAEAKARREQTRLAAAQRRYEKAAAWHARRALDIGYLGEGVSQSLSDARTDPHRLAARELPVLDSPKVLADAMGITVEELRFLTFHRSVSRISHYRRFGIPKKTGGLRMISAPMPRLKRAQYWVLDRVLAKLPVHDAAHGFVPGRSIVSNATPHAGQAVVVNFDLKDFFPSISYQRVRGLFQTFGYSRQLATLFAMICTELPTDEVSIDGLHFHVQNGERHLPQGAPCSPTITNLLCRRLDTRLAGLAKRLGFIYTRYADDMTFSADAASAGNLPRLLWQVKRIIAEEGFTLHPDKQRIMRNSARQEVTGVVVNHHPTVCRETLRRFRATLYQVEKDGPQGKAWNGNGDVLNALAGYARFVKMVDPAKGGPLCAKVAAVQAKWGDNASQPRGQYYRLFREASVAGKALPSHQWQAKRQPAPTLEKTATQLQQEKQATRQAESDQAAAVAAETIASAAALPTTHTQSGELIERNAVSADAIPPNVHEDVPASVYLQLAMQFVLMLVSGLLTGNVLMAMASVGWMWFGFKRRRANWWLWLGVYFACRLLWRLTTA
ncbi:reverse transcriptase family protein [Chitinivorax sp. B]|uniref:reverse transcriptase family protein n=1 Tax=Chitinivorax sp. B TaxID=2502235 RepID=UPI0010F6775E|nr:reverse transcriptase family protein [Chitinivorax sp. B]